ncbi:MAG TPA: 3'(2'),5'-bisphosphate nucleotidase CysQ, partial [Stellaceae bacterium]|nr:3'(2'),5'-bisphosphate nucleotidase CysQ [Stellaceae bacterium]
MRELLEGARRAARAAAVAIMEVYKSPFDVRKKADASPVTEADERAEAIIIEILAKLAPEIPIIAEEMAERGLPQTAARFWLVDPLDGTREFVAKNGEFTTNIGLIAGDRAVLGVIHLPVTEVTYAAAGIGTATRQEQDSGPVPIAARPVPASGAVIAHSRSHANNAQLAAYVAGIPHAQKRIGGSAAKFCLVAEGSADLYPRFGPTMEWDTAAGQAIVEAAGGSVTTFDGAPLRYAKPGFRNPE